MNQGVVFILLLLPLAVVLLLRSRVWSHIRPLLRPFDRLFVRPERLAWRRLSPLALFALRAWQSLLLLAFFLALLLQAGLPVPAIYVFHPLVEPPALLLLTAALCELQFRGAIARRASALALEAARRLPRALGFAAGFLVGYLPVAAGRFLGWYSRAYGRHRFDVGVDGLFPHLRDMARTDLWKWLGADRSSAGILFFAGCAAGLFLFAWERRARVRAFLALLAGRFHAAALAGAVVMVALLFYDVALRSGGDSRYIGPAVPAAYALVASGLLGRPSSRFRAGRIAALALLMGCGGWSLRAQAAARIAQIESADPRELIFRIRSEGYRVCYAGFWEGYKLPVSLGGGAPLHSLENARPEPGRVAVARRIARTQVPSVSGWHVPGLYRGRKPKPVGRR